MPSWVLYENIDNLRIVFGKDCIYPLKTKAIQYKTINDNPPLDVSEYIDKIVYIPILSHISWEEKYYGIPIDIEIYKNVKDASGLEYLKQYEKISNDNIDVYRLINDSNIEYVFYYSSYVYSLIFNNKIVTALADAIILDYIKSMN